MKYLELHEKWLKTGKLSHNGLCLCEELQNMSPDYFSLFYPSKEENPELFVLPFGDTGGFWAYDGEFHDVNDWSISVLSKYTPLRQTIVLFMEAMLEWDTKHNKKTK